MTVIVKHNKTNSITDWTQAQLNEQIALGNFAPGTTLANIVLPSDWNNDHTLTGIGTMAEQNATAVAITGGTIDNTTIGATTASTGKFTTITGQTETLIGTGQNLILQSQTFNTTWTQLAVSLTGSQTDPLGGSTAFLLLPSVANTVHELYQFGTNSIASSLTLSIFAKPNGYNFLYLQNGNSGQGAFFNLSTGVVVSNGTGITSTITASSNGYYRCTITLSVPFASQLFGIFPSPDGINSSFAGNGTSGINIWGAQLEYGTVANTYISTTTAAVYGIPLLSFSGVASIGLQSDGSLYETSAGTGNVRFYTNNIAQEQLRVSHTASAVNYNNLTGSATTKAPIYSVIGSDTNISMAFQPKGTGAIDLAAGSSGVNISNGGTVTAITRTATGSGYTSIPTIAVSAPTTAGGVQAVVTQASMAVGAVAINNGGTGYTVGNTLTVTGGTGGNCTITVSTVSSGVITGITFATTAPYTVLPTNPVSVTGGSGSSATFNLTYGISGTFTITNAGSGYIEQPTITFSGGGGSGASAFASVGSATIIRSLGSNLTINNPSGTSFAVSDAGATSAQWWQAIGGAFTGILRSTGSTQNGQIQTGGTGSIQLLTNSGAQEQLRVSHTASAVNYVQVTGSVTGNGVTLSSQGSDSAVAMIYSVKGFQSHLFQTNSGTTQFTISTTTSAVNRLNVTGSTAGTAPILSAVGTDTDIDLALTPKGTGRVQFGTRTASADVAITGYIEIKDAGGTVRRLAVVG